jgi:hypothetical protein
MDKLELRFSRQNLLDAIDVLQGLREAFSELVSGDDDGKQGSCVALTTARSSTMRSALLRWAKLAHILSDPTWHN